MKLMLPLVAVALIAGCSAEHAPSVQSPTTADSSLASPAASTPQAPAPSSPSTVTVTVSPSPSPAPAETTEVSGPCSDDDLSVTNGPLESANTLRHVVVSFKNTASHPCALQG